MKKRSSGILSAGVLLAGLLGGTIAAASSASAAATYECNTSKAMPKGSYNVLLPHQNYAPADPYWCYLTYGSQNSGVRAPNKSGARLATTGPHARRVAGSPW
ncbi:hypothetical protein ACFW24_37670 [Streptomyces nigra]|uniref:hypothetical protein n=1 Tax=Streptomyces nigra TaxID=1827580 RepID=UPI00368DD6AA